MSDLERKQKDDVAIYSKPTQTSNPNVMRRQGAKVIVPAGSPQDNDLSQQDVSVPENNRYTFLLKGDKDGGS